MSSLTCRNTTITVANYKIIKLAIWRAISFQKVSSEIFWHRATLFRIGSKRRRRCVRIPQDYQENVHRYFCVFSRGRSMIVKLQNWPRWSRDGKRKWTGFSPKSHSRKCGHSYDRPYLCIPCNDPQKRLLIYTISSKGPGISLRLPDWENIQVACLKSVITRVNLAHLLFRLFFVRNRSLSLFFLSNLFSFTLLFFIHSFKDAETLLATVDYFNQSQRSNKDRRN